MAFGYGFRSKQVKIFLCQEFSPSDFPSGEFAPAGAATTTSAVSMKIVKGYQRQCARAISLGLAAGE
jgi:hypothetical protein